jgi:hypothetical protein
MNPGLLNLIIGQIPGIIAMIKTNHAASDPNAPPVTDADVLAALQQAVASSIARDDQWLQAHPQGPDIGGDVPGGGAV